MSEENSRAVVELFVKAGVDRMKVGGCPLCHRYFIAFYILREQGLIDLVVTTFLPENAPLEVLAFSNGKHYPLAKVHSGIDASGKNISGLECDSIDEIEALLDRFDCDEMRNSRVSMEERKAEKVIEDLYQKFMAYLRDAGTEKQTLIKYLERLEDFLRNNGTKFLIGHRLAKADCYLLPTLQHIRVAGKAYRGFEIPTEFSAIWAYISNAYNTEAFVESCPADREIISQYELKVAHVPQKLSKRASSLMGDDRTLSVPTSFDRADLSD